MIYETWLFNIYYKIYNIIYILNCNSNSGSAVLSKIVLNKVHIQNNFISTHVLKQNLKNTLF